MGKALDLLKKIRLLEMANAIPKYTGIDGHIIYFSTKYELENTQSHILGRIKVYKSTENLGTISILKNNDEFVINGFNSKDGKKVLPKVKKFIELNSNLLWKYWNTKPEEADSASTMKSFKKVK